MTDDRIDRWISRSADYSFSRSGGPGGQNVNKVNTKVTVTLPLDESPLSDAELVRLRERLGPRINANDEILIQAQEERTQSRNRRLAEKRLRSLIRTAIRPPKRRKQTGVPRGAKQRRLENKRKQAEKKRRRRWSPENDR